MLLPKSQPFIWNLEEYKNHIESVCNTVNQYTSDKFILYFCRSLSNAATLNWATILSVKNNSNEPLVNLKCLVGNLDEMIETFIELVPLEEK
jgi:hypothetical protein